MKLTVEQVGHLAELARLELGEEELNTMTGQFASILEYVDRIQQVDTAGVEPFTMPAKDEGWRKDEAYVCDDAARDIILSNFPSRAGDLLAAPGVFQTPKK